MSGSGRTSSSSVDHRMSTALLVGLVSVVCVQPLGVVAVHLGRQELRRIRRGECPWLRRGQVVTGIALGLIALATCVVAVVILAVEVADRVR